MLALGVDLERFAKTLENEWTASGLVFFAVGPIENRQVLMWLLFRKGWGKYVQSIENWLTGVTSVVWWSEKKQLMSKDKLNCN